MALTAAELARITAIEEAINNVQIAVSNLATKQMVRQIELLRQSDLATINAKLDELEAMMAVLQNAL